MCIDGIPPRAFHSLYLGAIWFNNYYWQNLYCLVAAATVFVEGANIVQYDICCEFVLDQMKSTPTFHRAHFQRACLRPGCMKRVEELNQRCFIYIYVYIYCKHREQKENTETKTFMNLFLILCDGRFEERRGGGVSSSYSVPISFLHFVHVMK